MGGYIEGVLRAVQDEKLAPRNLRKMGPTMRVNHYATYCVSHKDNQRRVQQLIKFSLVGYLQHIPYYSFKPIVQWQKN
jgi:hypothetical protein